MTTALQAHRLRQYRTNAGMSLRQLAAAAGVSYATVHRVEKGISSPHRSTQELLAAALGVPSRVVFPAHSSDYHTPDGTVESDSRPGGRHANDTTRSDLHGV